MQTTSRRYYNFILFVIHILFIIKYDVSFLNSCFNIASMDGNVVASRQVTNASSQSVQQPQCKMGMRENSPVYLMKNPGLQLGEISQKNNFEANKLHLGWTETRRLHCYQHTKELGNQDSTKMARNHGTKFGKPASMKYQKRIFGDCCQSSTLKIRLV